MFTALDAKGELIDLDFVTGSVTNSGVGLGGPARVFGLGPALLGVTREGMNHSLVLDRAGKRVLFDSGKAYPQRGRTHRAPRYCPATDRVLIAVGSAPRRGAVSVQFVTLDGAGALLDDRVVKRTNLREWWADWSHDGGVLLLEEKPDAEVLVSLFEGPEARERLVATVDDVSIHSRVIGGLRKSARGSWLFVEVTRTDRAEDGVITSWVRDPTA